MAWTVAFAALTAVRLLLAWRYGRSRTDMQPAMAPGVTILQPILSGDAALPACLGDNLRANPGARFLWLVDHDDGPALDLVQRLVAGHPEVAIEVVVGPGPSNGENPKMAKLIAGQTRVTSETLIVLDDDTVLPPRGAAALATLARRGGIATGMPVYVSHATLAERLVAGMINGQALATYFAMAAVGANHTINGMVYAVSRAELETVGGFAAAGHEVTDDYAVARLWERNGLPIVQSAVLSSVVISFASLADAAKILRRWFIFANRYLARNQGPATWGLVIAPSLLPALGILPALMAGWPWALLWPAALAGKAVANGLVLRRFSGIPLTLGRVACEMAADVLLPAIYASSLIRSRQLSWRSRRIELSGDTIRYR
jgi:ceramide glucosyltransferase